MRVPRKQPKRGRLWLTDGSCIRLRPARLNHVWAYDFVAARTHDGRPFRILTIIDEYTRECLAMKVARSIRSDHVLECLADLFVIKGVPEHIRSDNGPEFTARVVRNWLPRVGASPLFIEPGSPLGERLCGELQRQAQGRVPGPRDFLHPQGGAGAYRAMAQAVQRDPPTQRPGLSAACSCGDLVQTGVVQPTDLDRQKAGSDRLGTNIASGTTLGGRSPVLNPPASALHLRSRQGARFGTWEGGAGAAVAGAIGRCRPNNRAFTPECPGRRRCRARRRWNLRFRTVA